MAGVEGVAELVRVRGASHSGSSSSFRALDQLHTAEAAEDRLNACAAWDDIWKMSGRGRDLLERFVIIARGCGLAAVVTRNEPDMPEA